VIGATPGERFEVLVAGALWDLFDTANDGYDQFSASFADIFNTLWSAGQGFCNTWVDPPVAFQCISSQRTFRDFYRDWRARGLNPIPVNAAAFQNRINLNNTPRVVSFTAPTGTVASGSTVTLTVAGADDTGGFIDGLISSARFEYSTNGGASWSLVPGLVQPAGANTFSLAWNLGQLTGTVNVRARARQPGCGFRLGTERAISGAIPAGPYRTKHRDQSGDADRGPECERHRHGPESRRPADRRVLCCFRSARHRSAAGHGQLLLLCR
jgi:hypothetical protein